MVKTALSSRHTSFREKKKTATVDYTDYRGVRAKRHILPIRLCYGWRDDRSDYCIVGIDLETKEIRTFAIKNIHSWVDDG
jgi:hypothetical protein